MEGTFETVFTKYPELYDPTFWEMMMAKADEPDSAQDILDALSEIGAEGAAYSLQVANNMAAVMQKARKTLRMAEIKRWNPQKR